MEELLKMWFSNELEHLAGLEIKGELILPKEIVSESILEPTLPQLSSKIAESDKTNMLSSEEFNNMLHHLVLKGFSLQLKKASIHIKLDVTR
jgi:hypothetical protein